MDRREREQFCMTHISFVNQLYGGEELKRLQRKSERFVNSGLVATLSGAVASDTLEDERVLSGVGGQYNFGAPAHALDDGRSILMIRSTREAGSKLHSGIRWSYYQGHEMSFARSEVPLAIWDEGCRRAPWTGAKEESCL
ncbi:MAG TPA: acetyl-CoA hydrolase/transferase C-terminal domain-containing protein [Longimicrobiales bacterium]|nr:acetyl-CoA hydrolase/transferase C-terminal domain-containing protein [Longimicrobiales bacterium]